MTYSLSQLFGECPVDILEILAENIGNPVSRADIARITGLPRSTVNRHFKILLKRRIVKDSGEKYRKAPLFMLDLENEISSLISLLHHTLIAEELERKIHDAGECTYREEFSMMKIQARTQPTPELTGTTAGWQIPLESNSIGWKNEGILDKNAMPYHI